MATNKQKILAQIALEKEAMPVVEAILEVLEKFDVEPQVAMTALMKIIGTCLAYERRSIDQVVAIGALIITYYSEAVVAINREEKKHGNSPEE